MENDTTEPLTEPTTERDAPATPALEASAHPSAAIVDAWFAKHFHSMSALYDERAYAHLIAAKEDLKTVLAPPAP